MGGAYENRFNQEHDHSRCERVIRESLEDHDDSAYLVEGIKAIRKVERILEEMPPGTGIGKLLEDAMDVHRQLDTDLRNERMEQLREVGNAMAVASERLLKAIEDDDFGDGVGWTGMDLQSLGTLAGEFDRVYHALEKVSDGAWSALA